MDVTCRFHECYPPFIKIYSQPHQDRYGNIYWRAFYENDKLGGIGFVVREKLYVEWEKYQIAEISFSVTSPEITNTNEPTGISRIEISNFFTFGDLEIRGETFIEIRGIYLAGSFTMKSLAGQGKERITFLPSLPNRFSFNSRRDFETGELLHKFECYTLKSYGLPTLNRLHKFAHLTPKAAWETFERAIFYFIVVDKYETFIHRNYDSHGEIEEKEEEIVHSIVYEACDDFLDAVMETERADKEFVLSLKEAIGNGMIKLDERIERLRQIREISKKIISIPLKFEYELSNLLILNNNIQKYPFSFMRGKRYDRTKSANGAEEHEIIEHFGDIEVEDEDQSFYISINLIIQV